MLLVRCLIFTTKIQENNATPRNNSPYPMKCISQSDFHAISASSQSGKGSGFGCVVLGSAEGSALGGVVLFISGSADDGIL